MTEPKNLLISSEPKVARVEVRTEVGDLQIFFERYPHLQPPTPPRRPNRASLLAAAIIGTTL